jgi:hypothetical protein
MKKAAILGVALLVAARGWSLTTGDVCCRLREFEKVNYVAGFMIGFAARGKIGGAPRISLSRGIADAVRLMDRFFADMDSDNAPMESVLMFILGVVSADELAKSGDFYRLTQD